MSNLHDLEGLSYRPRSPKEYFPRIALIGCGGISKYHLQAYRSAGFNVTALCDLNIALAEERSAEYFPQAKIYANYRQLLQDDSIEVVDIATHPPERPPIIEASLLAGKHVLSQKPFVTDLDEGERLIDLAVKQGKYLAVNQNGRWAPHFSYARSVASSGIIGRVFGAHLACHWDHTWVKGTEFETVKHLVLYDYAIHWFDILRCLIPENAVRIFASSAPAPDQQLWPNLLGQVAVEFEHAQATLVFDAALPFGSHEKTFLSATAGSLHSFGTGNQQQTLTVTTENGSWSPNLKGTWFPDGFHGTMGELLCAIEEKRECSISAVDNLQSLALCFAAIESAETRQVVIPGSVRRMPA